MLVCLALLCIFVVETTVTDPDIVVNHNDEWLSNPYAHPRCFVCESIGPISDCSDNVFKIGANRLESKVIDEFMFTVFPF